MKRNFSILLLILFVLSLCSSCALKAEPITIQEYLMGTIINITIYDKSDRELLEDCIGLCRNYETMFSRTIEGGELYNLNLQLANSGEAEVSDELCAIIKDSLYYSHISEGAFDITIGSVSSLWDFVSGTDKIPEKAEIEEAIKLVSYSDVKVDGNVISAPIGTSFDLGAIAKGYIADRVKEYLIDRGAESAIINLGGNVLCIGGLTQEESFTIGVKEPFGESGELAALIKIRGLSAVTSGTYERNFVSGDRLYHHILDPATGYPAKTGLQSVVIISRESELGDAMSTACFILGTEKAVALIEGMENVYAMFIEDEGNIVCTQGFEEATQASFT